MIRFTLLFLVMTVLFLSGVIVGFDQAGEGIENIRGDFLNQYDAVQIHKKDQEPIEIQVMGRTLEEKKVQYQKIENDHMTEKLAFAMEKGVKWFYNQVIQGVYKISELLYRI
ncbi:MAG: DUF3679 domain-containing protein [Bacillaceae bacterium]|nr:DUF3679 domain-containing protein [Bacillaceae bacterium]